MKLTLKKKTDRDYCDSDEFNIEIEVLLNRVKKVFKIDELREKLELLTTFFDRVKTPVISDQVEWEDTDVLSSTRYNEFLAGAERDLSLVYQSQNKVKEKALVNWNNIEQIRSSKIEEDIACTARSGTNTIIDKWELDNPNEPMDGDDVDDICEAIKGLLNTYYAND